MDELFDGPAAGYDLVCLSHLRWDFVWQRPQQLLSRAARSRRVFYVEEPVDAPGAPRMEVAERGGVLVAVPAFPGGVRAPGAWETQRALLDGLLASHGVGTHVLWVYSPMGLGFARHLRPLVTVYDCMDELSAFRYSPPELLEREAELLQRADLVFTGGASLYEAKRGRHPSVHLFPSSIDAAHFGRARAGLPDPPDQAPIPRPRLGWFGVIDERVDYALLAALADARPGWSVVMVGPLAKVEESELPRRPNLHWLGARSYDALPAYAAWWDVALLPFARNEATRFISPTKTPEYLAAGVPVVSTPIRDVERPYGDLGLVRIAGTPGTFVSAVEAALSEGATPEWLTRVDHFLAGLSWDRTWAEMDLLIAESAKAGSVPG